MEPIHNLESLIHTVVKITQKSVLIMYRFEVRHTDLTAAVLLFSRSASQLRKASKRRMSHFQLPGSRESKVHISTASLCQ